MLDIRDRGFFKCFNFLGQLIDRFAILLRGGFLDLLTEFLYSAVGLCFGFVAADYCHDLLCVTLAHPRVLSMCVDRYGDEQQNSNNELSVHYNVRSTERVVAGQHPLSLGLRNVESTAQCGRMVLCDLEASEI